MIRTYKIDLVHQIKSLRYVFIILMSFIILFYIMAYNQIIIPQLEFYLGISLFFFGPAIYLHINYLFENYKVVLSINHIAESFVLEKDGQQHSYKFSDIMSLERHLGIYYRDTVDQAGRKVAAWTPYGYLNLRLNDGKYFNLTCLMVDIQNPPFISTHTYFRFIPYAKASPPLREKREIASENFKNEVSYYEYTFKDLPNHQLEKKIKNYKSYVKAAIEASRKILESRKQIKQ